MSRRLLSISLEPPVLSASPLSACTPEVFGAGSLRPAESDRLLVARLMSYPTVPWPRSHTVRFESAEIVAVAQLDKQLLEDRPVPVATSGTELALEVAFDVVLDAVVVEQRVVHIDQKNNGVR